MSYDPNRATANPTRPTSDGFYCQFCRHPLNVYYTCVAAKGIRRRYKRCEQPDCKAHRRSHVVTEERVRRKSG